MPQKTNAMIDFSLSVEPEAKVLVKRIKQWFIQGSQQLYLVRVRLEL